MGIERFVPVMASLALLGLTIAPTSLQLKRTPKQRSELEPTDIDYLVKKNIKRKFNPRSAPHHRGVWERLVRSFKHTFYAILANRRLPNEILATTFCIAEQSPYAGPPVPASADAMEIDALTPNRFLLGIAGSSLPSLANCDFDQRKCYVQAHTYSDAIWSRWLKKYVTSLKGRTKWPSLSNRDLQTGDFVWIVEPTSPRGYYLLARVVKVNFGSDAVARSAEVRTASGNLIRPLVKLAPVLPASDSD